MSSQTLPISPLVSAERCRLQRDGLQGPAHRCRAAGSSRLGLCSLNITRNGACSRQYLIIPGDFR